MFGLILSGCGDGGGSLPPCEPQPEASCSSGSCIGEAWTAGGKLGEPCDSSKDCGSGLCATDPASGQRCCTQSCDADLPGSCPNGAECLATADPTLSVCGPPACR